MTAVTRLAPMLALTELLMLGAAIMGGWSRPDSSMRTQELAGR